MIPERECDCSLTDKNMKNTVFLVISFFFMFSCNQENIKKPNKLIEEEMMIDIIYDISILEAINSVNPGKLDEYQIDSRQYIFKKYKIDSIQFAENSAYYASDLKKFKKMYEKVENRIVENKKLADCLRIKNQEVINKAAIELRTLSKDSLKKTIKKEAKEFLNKQK
ncbi:DUF4296 domain-containing protein [Flavobacterium piscinae]|uniref:DUF4296 domain-containing protein n=2 Tax=Flavobacterium piscinae TaxID=2506424 RepID=A0A4Q1KYF8_9FLAO|nr:DUF4296 domain-containing protein [Flavobacterium piscinae]